MCIRDSTYLRERASDYVLWPEIIIVDLGFANDVRDGRRGPKTKVLTLAEQVVRVEKRKKQNREAKQRFRAAAKVAKKAA